MMIKQALIYVEPSLKLSPNDKPPTDAIPWRVSVVIGYLDGWKSVPEEVAKLAWADGTCAIRSAVTKLADRNDTAYLFGFSAARYYVVDASAKASPENTWITLPKHFASEGIDPHDLLALEKSGYPLKELRAGDVFKRISPLEIPGEDWWPGKYSSSGTALLLPKSSGSYAERLERAFTHGDYDAALRLMRVSPNYNDKVNNHFKTNPQLLDSVSIYVTAGMHANCVVGSNFYSTRVKLSGFLSLAMDVLGSMEYECYQSEGTETFKEWATSGRLPSGLTIFTHKLLG